ncbi:hypothetical protein THRCLA_03325 [Thraustotheca clavata]|uniref:SWIM-type domain-containing protein n=1 Tax=Thraustotheca clavata TaxID=74557 RepID=A0A1W0A308_9STRA|nr:hypothetical protein THRCLA_03325 [Thraustotheca clavata]
METIENSTQAITKEAGLTCIQALCEKNMEIILSLIPLDLILNLTTQLKVDTANKHIILDIMQCLVATSFRHGCRALELGVIDICIDLVTKEELTCAPGACLLLTRLIRVFGVPTSLQPGEKINSFVQCLISQKFIDYFAHHSGSLYWMACIYYTTECSDLCRHIVNSWDSSGSAFILQLVGRLHLRQTETNVCVVHHESIPFTALRLLNRLIVLKSEAFLERLLKLDDAWKHIINDAFHAIKDIDTNFYAYSLLQTTLIHSSGNFFSTQLFVKLTQVFHDFDLANPARRPLYFELLATYLSVHCVAEDSNSFVHVVQLPLMNWTNLFEQCIHGFMAPGWARYSSLQLLHSFLQLQNKLTSPLALPPTLLINLKIAVQSIADSYKDASLLEVEHGHAFPSLGLVASTGLDADIIYASEQAFDLHLLPITDHALIFLQHHATEHHLLPLLHFSNGVYANKLLGPLRDWQTKQHSRSLRVNERILSSYHLEKKRGTVAVPGVASRHRSRAMTFAVKPNLANESTWAGFSMRRTFTTIVNCLLLMEIDPLGQNFLYIDQIARATMHCFINSDGMSSFHTEVWLKTLYFAAAQSSNKVSLVTENCSLIITLLRLAGSRNNNYRKLATSCLWKMLESDLHLHKLPQLVIASNIEIIGHLKLSLTLEAPQLGATGKNVDFVLSTIGLLAVLCRLPEMLEIVIRENLVGSIMHVVRHGRPSSLSSANFLFLCVIECILLKSSHLENMSDIVLHCLRCLELDNKLELRSKAIYILYLISKLSTGLHEIQEHLFPTTSKDSTTTLQAMVHLFVLTETLKFHHDQNVLMASIYLINELCDVSTQIDCLRVCRESSTESMIDLMAGVLEATIGTKHQNHVTMQQTQLKQIVLETGILTLDSLTKFATHYDIFRFVASGNRIIIQLFASMGWQQLEVSYVASVLLCRIFEFATDPRVEQLLLHMPHEEDSEEDEEGNSHRRTSLIRGTSSLQIDRNLPTNHPKRHSLNRFRCFRHKKGGEIPSYFELLASWVACFADTLLVEQIPLLYNIFNLLQTTLNIFYATIYLPTTEYCRQHHRHLLRDIFALTFKELEESSDIWQEIQIQGLTIMYHLSCHPQDYVCSLFENPSSIQKLLELIRSSENQCQYESARLLRAITRHEDVKQVFYRHQLYSYVGWMNEPHFVNILEPFIQSVKNLLLTSKIPGYDPLRLARLLLSAPAQRSSTFLSSHATVFRQVKLRFSLDMEANRTIKVQMTIQSSNESRDIYRRYFLPSSKDFGEEILFLELDVRSILIVVSLSNEKEKEINFTYDISTRAYTKTFPLSDMSLLVSINEDTCCDLTHLSGPLGDVLWFCVDHEMQIEMGLIEELIGELCKHDDVFCEIELHLWSYVAYLLNYGSKHDNPMAGMHCLKSIADCASTVQKDIYLRHSLNLIQMLNVYNLSSEKNVPHEWASPCLRHKEVSCFLLAIADIASKCLSKTQAATYMSMLLLEYRGVVRYLCGFHRSTDHLCCTSLKIQSQLIQLWPSHALILSKKRFIQENLRYFESNGHLSDTCIDQAAAYIMKLIIYTRSCRKFVENQGLELLGKLANVLYLRYCSSSTVKIANILRQFVLIGALLRGNLLVVTPLPVNIQSLFFPKTLQPDVMPYLEMILWPLLKDDENVLDCSQLAATIFVELSEICLERTLVEKQLIRIAFRLDKIRVEQLQKAVQCCIRYSSWDQKFGVQAIQKIYYIAVLRGIKTGILSAECKELLPTQAIPKLTQSHDKILHTKHESLQEDNEFHQELLYCLQFTEQHREGRLRDILVRNRKKGIGEMLRAVDNSARLMLFVHRVLQMAVETYNGISSTIPQASAKQDKFRTFCGYLESLALIVISVLPQLDATYFVHIFYQFRELRFPESRLDTHVIERRHFMRNNMKKLLFLLKRIIDKKKLQSVLDESSFTAAETILRDIRLDFAVNGCRRLGQPSGLDGTIADFLCEAIEMKGMAPFVTLLSSARYLYARTMRKDDNSYYELGIDFMVGTMKDIGLAKAIQLMLKALGARFIKLIMHPIDSLYALYDKFHPKPIAESSVRKSLSRHYSVSLAQTMYCDEERSLISFFPTASVLTLTHHEAAAASSGDLLWEHIRLHCTSTIDEAIVLNRDFIQLMSTRISRTKQEKIELFVGKDDVNSQEIDAAINTIDMELLRKCFEEYLAKTKGIDVDLDIVQHATLPVNVWNFLLGPVYHTKLLHAEYILDEIRKQKAVTIKTAEMILSTPDTTPIETNDPVKKLSALVNLPLRPIPRLMRKGTSRRNFQRNPIGMNIMKSIGMAKLVEMDDYKSPDDIKKEHIDVIYTDYILKVSDQNLEDPLSEQMAWEYLIIEINRNSFPRWVFEVNDPGVPVYRRLFARSLRWTLRAFLNITFWRLEELKLDLQDDSWPEGEVLKTKRTRRKCLAQDIVHSIVIHKHFKKAISELFTVWMKESGSLGLRLWQHWIFFVFSWLCPVLLFYVILPQIQLDSAQDPRTVDYYMKWVMGSFFLLIFVLVLLSIMQLIKQSENMMVQERQMVRFYPVLGFHGNYLALYSLFMELVQQNTIPFSNSVQWVSGFKIPKAVAALGNLGITGLDVDSLKSVMKPLDLLYFKAYAAITIVLAYMTLLKCANKFHKGYPKLNQRLTKDLPPIVSSIMFVAIINTFSSFLFCCTCDQFTDPNSQCSHTQPFLYAYTDVDLVCWSPDHLPLAFIGLVGLSYFLPIGILSAGMGEVLFPRENVDIKFSPIVVLASQMGKTISILASLFFTFYRKYMVTISMITNTVLFFMTIYWKTSSIWYISIIKSSIYVMSVWTSICAFVNIALPSPNSSPVYYLNLGWFIIFCIALLILGLKMRVRNVREELARRERLRDYQLLNASSEEVRLTDMEEDFMRRSLKHVDPAKLEASAPPGFIEAARAKTKAMETQQLPPHLDDFLEKARRSAVRPTTSETMFLRRARRLGRRIALFEESENLRESYRKKHLTSA